MSDDGDRESYLDPDIASGSEVPEEAQDEWQEGEGWEGPGEGQTPVGREGGAPDGLHTEDVQSPSQTCLK